MKLSCPIPATLLLCSLIWCATSAQSTGGAPNPAEEAFSSQLGSDIATKPAVLAADATASASPSTTTTTVAQNTTTTTTTLAPNTTTTTTTTVAPNTTTTTTTTTTTVAPNTTTTTTTTVAPNTTTTATTTTTTTTAAVPVDPSEGHWIVSNDNNSEICILAKMALQMKIPYLKVDNQTSMAVIDVPVNASARGSCAATGQSILLEWLEQNMFRVTFAHNISAGRYSVESITVQLAMDDQQFPAHSNAAPFVNLRVNFTEPIGVAVNSSYRCSSSQTYQLLDGSGGSGELLLIGTQLQAYRTSNTTTFAAPLVCAADHRAASDIVPIAVGVALAVLVIAILVRYIVGRRRARQRGYQSV